MDGAEVTVEVRSLQRGKYVCGRVLHPLGALHLGVRSSRGGRTARQHKPSRRKRSERCSSTIASFLTFKSAEL